MRNRSPGEPVVGVSQNRVIIGKFPQKYLFLTGGVVLLSKRFRMAGAVPAWGYPCIYLAPFGVNDLQS